jgi:hypothetical protein
MKRIGPSLTVMFAVAVISGCGHAPTAPLVDSPDSSSLKTGAAPASVAPKPGGPVSPPATDPVPGDYDAPTATSVKSTTNVNGSVGKSLSLGHVRVDIPKLAYHGKADVSIAEPDPAALEVHITILPVSKGRLLKPAVITFDAAACGQDCRLMQVQQFDSARNAWVEIPASVDAANGTISASTPTLGRFKAVCEVKRVGR